MSRSLGIGMNISYQPLGLIVFITSWSENNRTGVYLVTRIGCRYISLQVVQLRRSSRNPSRWVFEDL